MTPCARAQCPAVPDVAVCRVHTPDKIVERAKAIVSGNFERLTGFDAAHADLVNQVRADILRDLEATV